MSLVSAVNDHEQRGILGSPGDGSAVQTVTTTQRSVEGGGKPAITTRTVRGFAIYHKGDGAQLSKGALYRAKVKYGIYQSPARSHSTGVAEPQAASDAAANHATGNKTTIEAYKRLFVNPNAHKAAARSVVNGPRVEATVIPSSHHGSHQAATRAYTTASAASVENARLAQRPVLPAASTRPTRW